MRVLIKEMRCNYYSGNLGNAPCHGTYLILDGNSEAGANVWSYIGNLICLGHWLFLYVENRIFL